jgi:phospholipid/cholesterol/gamma-HCH transport system substrate-binding protein
MFLVDGMVLSGEASGASEFFPREVQKKIETLVDSIGALANNINDILGDTDNKANIKETLANMTVLTDQTTKTLKSLEGFSDTGTDAIRNTADRLDSTLSEMQMVLAKVNTGDGTAARVLNDGQLYENLLDSSEELKMSLEQLRIFVNDINEKGVGVNIKLW